MNITTHCVIYVVICGLQEKSHSNHMQELTLSYDSKKLSKKLDNVHHKQDDKA